MPTAGDTFEIAEYLLWSSARLFESRSMQIRQLWRLQVPQWPSSIRLLPHACRKPCERSDANVQQLAAILVWSLQQACRRFTLTGPSPGLSPQAVASGRCAICLR